MSRASEGHLFEGKEGYIDDCPTCGRLTDSSKDYMSRRSVKCWSCGKEDRLETRAKNGDWQWEVVLVERSRGRERELAIATRDEITAAERSAWEPALKLAKIPNGQETRVLTRHGFAYWHDLYPRRQRVLIERLLAFATEASEDEQVLHILRLAIIGSAEMAGHLSRWDRYYLKSYESMAGHRFNFSTFVAEPNVWGASASGRGTVRRRLESFAKIADWTHKRIGRTLEVDSLLASTKQRSAVPDNIDVRIVEGSSERILLPDGSVDLVLTDPPYHDDVQYDELSLLFRAWAELSVKQLEASASVNRALEHNSGEDEYEALLTRLFTEIRRTLRADGHLIFSYANRAPEAWVALLSALDRAGLRACGYLVVHSENESDVVKRGVRACMLDLIMDLIPNSERLLVDQWKPPSLPATEEGVFLGIVGETFLQVGTFSENWADDLTKRLRETAFNKGAKKANLLEPTTPPC